jgi:hypothetical protein
MKYDNLSTGDHSLYLVRKIKHKSRKLKLYPSSNKLFLIKMIGLQKNLDRKNYLNNKKKLGGLLHKTLSL